MIASTLAPRPRRANGALLALVLALSGGGCAGDDGEGSTTGTATQTTSTSGSTSTAMTEATTEASTATTTAGETTGVSGTMTDGTTTGEPTTSTTGEPTTSTTTGEPTTTTTGDTTTTTGTTGDPLHPTVTLETTLGTIVLELDAELAPITTANFLTYVESGFYDGDDNNGATVFHRVVAGFVIQGGGLTATNMQKSTLPPIVNESGNGLQNVYGSIAMARTMNPDSATSQFYINLVDNLFLDEPPGYAVFGQVIEGIEVVDAIGAVAVDNNDKPLEPVIILDVYQN